MPVSISLEGAEFTQFVASVFPPNMEDAIYYGVYGDEDTYLKNLVTDVDGTVVGVAPVQGANFASFKRDYGLLTDVSIDTPITMYAVTKRPEAGSGAGIGIMGAYSGGGAGRQILMMDPFNGVATTPGTFVDYVNSQRYAPASPVLAVTDFNLIFSQFDGTTVQTGFCYTDGSGNPQVAKSAGAYTFDLVSTPLRVGGTGYGSVNTVNLDIAAAAAFSSILTVEQILAEYEYHKNRMTALGLTLN